MANKNKKNKKHDENINDLERSGYDSRQDSLSMFTNFNSQPRFSNTEVSIASFLNISDQNPNGAGSGKGVDDTAKDKEKGDGLKKKSDSANTSLINKDSKSTVNKTSNSNTTTSSNTNTNMDTSAGTRNSSITNPDLSSIGRGFSIVNNMWPQQQQQQQSDSQNDTRFNNPVYSNTNINSNSGNGKRYSVYFGPNESPETDLFASQQNKKDQPQMKPPMLVPSNNTNNQKNNEFDTMFNSHPTSSNNPMQFQLPQSRNNSLKFSADDLDFQFRRNSSIIRAANIPPPNLLTLQQQQQYQFHPNNGTNMQQPQLHQQQITNAQGLMYPPQSQQVNNYLQQQQLQLQQQQLQQLQQLQQEPSSNTTSKKQKSSKPRKSSKKGKVSKKQTKNQQKNKKKIRDNEENDSIAELTKENPMLTNNGIIMNNGKPELISKSSNDEDALTQEQIESSRPLLGVTKVDQLMLMIEARKKGVTEKVNTTDTGELILDRTSDILPPSNQLVGGVEKPKSAHGIKQHECPYCHRFFTQSTHLEVHVRSHIGYKPFQCEFCGKRFTQGGNLRTHQRLHTGEKPYNCEMCGKKFSRKGNLAAHALTHQKLKPFVCKLENCNKSFTQLGNMKAHQNRFHLKTLMQLTNKLANMNPNTDIPNSERELLEYFASIYKNSNKGIKGRGKNSNNLIHVPLSNTNSTSSQNSIPTQQQLNTNGSVTGISNIPGNLIPDRSNVILDPSKDLMKLPSPTHNLQQDKIGGVNYEFASMTNQQQAPSSLANSNDFDFNLENQGVPKGMRQRSHISQQQPFQERVHFNDINFKG